MTQHDQKQENYNTKTDKNDQVSLSSSSCCFYYGDTELGKVLFNLSIENLGTFWWYRLLHSDHHCDDLYPLCRWYSANILPPICWFSLFNSHHHLYGYLYHWNGLSITTSGNIKLTLGRLLSQVLFLAWPNIHSHYAIRLDVDSSTLNRWQWSIGCS